MGGRRRQERAWPEERTSSKFLVALDWDVEDEGALDPEAALIAAEEAAPEPAASGALGDWADMRRYLHRVPPVEADMMRLYYEDRLPERAVAQVLGFSQPGVSYRILKCRRRVEWLRTLDERLLNLAEEDIARDLPDLSPFVRRMLWLVWKTTSQTETARQLSLDGWTNATQSKVSCRLRKVVRGMASFRAFLASSWASLLEKVQWAALTPEAQEEARKAHEDRLSRLDMYISFYTSMWVDKRWNMLRAIEFGYLKDGIERRQRQNGITAFTAREDSGK